MKVGQKKPVSSKQRIKKARKEVKFWKKKAEDYAIENIGLRSEVSEYKRLYESQEERIVLLKEELQRLNYRPWYKRIFRC